MHGVPDDWLVETCEYGLLQHVLTELTDAGWDVFTVLPDPDPSKAREDRARIICRRTHRLPAKGGTKRVG